MEVNLDTPEAECLLNYCEERQRKRLGTILLFTGGSGSGKSYAGTRFCELWYKKKFNEDFPADKSICENLEQAIIIVKNFKREGEAILIEELSVLAGVRDSLSTANKLWNKFLDTVRIKMAIIVANCPHISFIDKHFQMMCNCWVNCEGVDFENNIVKAHPLWLQTSPHKSEPYKHCFLNKEGWQIDYIIFRKPSKNLLDQYDTLKERSVNELYDELALKMINDRVNQLKKMGAKVLAPRELQAYELYLKGYNSKDGAKEMGLKDYDVYNKYLLSAKTRLSKPEYLIYARKLEDFHKKTQSNSKEETPTRN